ncbi:hypothetical protein LOK49_Contig138G00002 [Camellia lanceoleosa]|nr:hypothetical protein LOK49_Contig138G00002 [Camellia lanceoleosa]
MKNLLFKVVCLAIFLFTVSDLRSSKVVGEGCNDGAACINGQEIDKKDSNVKAFHRKSGYDKQGMAGMDMEHGLAA